MKTNNMVTLVTNSIYGYATLPLLLCLLTACESAPAPKVVALPEKNVSHPNPGDPTSGNPGDEEPVRDPMLQDVIYSQTYTVAPQERKIDILFVVDNSGSMNNEQTIIADSFRNFISSFQDRDLNFNIAVTTTDMKATSLAGFQSNGKGSFVSFGTNDRILNPLSTNLVQQFTDNVKVGINGDGGEMGLAAATEALSSQRLAAWNQNFVRPDAFLSVIIVSDEDESKEASQQAYVRDFPVLKAERLAAFKASSQAAKGTQLNNVRVDAVVKPVGAACTTALTTGITYSEVAAAYNGKTVNICEVFSSRFEDLGEEIAIQVQSHFAIPRAIDELKNVYLNGQKLNSPSEYVYNASTNDVQIVGTALSVLERLNSEIKLEYMVREIR